MTPLSMVNTGRGTDQGSQCHKNSPMALHCGIVEVTLSMDHRYSYRKGKLDTWDVMTTPRGSTGMEDLPSTTGRQSLI